MKNVLAVLLVLAISTSVNAEILITVDNVINPQEIVTMPSDTLSIGLWGDGNSEEGAFFMGIYADSVGAGSFDIDDAIIFYPGETSWIEWSNDPEVAEILSVENPFLSIGLMDLYPPYNPLGPGMLVYDIMFHCDNIGDVTIGVFDGMGELLDSQLIQQVAPEPMTIVLLALGGLMLRRKR